MNYIITDNQLNELKELANGNVYIVDMLEHLERQNNIVCERITESSKLIEWLRFGIGYETQENFNVIYANANGNIIKNETLFKGGKHSSIVEIDEILRHAIILKASAIFVSHNHPNGNTEPSKADLELTNNLKKASKLIGIPLLDHVIVSPSSSYSFKEHGLI